MVPSLNGDTISKNLNSPKDIKPHVKVIVPQLGGLCFGLIRSGVETHFQLEEFGNIIDHREYQHKRDQPSADFTEIPKCVKETESQDTGILQTNSLT